MNRVQIDVWSDYVCPFCYLEEPVLERLSRERGDLITIRWRAFELRPDPIPTLDPKGDYLRDIWERAVYPMAAQRGMTLRLPPTQPRSRLAHEAAKFAEAHGVMAAMNLALFKAFFEAGRDIGDRAVLVEIAGRVGLENNGLNNAFSRGLYREPVLADEALAQQLGIAGVPAMLVRREGDAIEQAIPVSGAQSYENLVLVMNRLSGD
jgi:predicted DsbA family dithiol-disulfide isomerase